MNKKELAHIRRQFKLESDLLQIFDILNVYVMKESHEPYHVECRPFGLLDRDKQELYIANFKKLLTGQFGQKLFELQFQPDEASEAGEPTRRILHQALSTEQTDEWSSFMVKLVEKMLQDDTYERDTVITFIRGKYARPTKARNEAAETSDRDEVYEHPFILCSINSTEQQQKSLQFDLIEREFKYHVIVDPIIKLSSPQQGFFYPSVTDHAANVNRILYCTGKANAPNAPFIEHVLHAEQTVTVQEERQMFEEIVKEVAGEQLEAATLAHVYEEVQHVIESDEEEEPPKLDYQDVERLLTASGIEEVTTEKVEQAFEAVTANKHAELHASNVIPKYYSKSIKIETKVATISISPEDLKYVKQVNYQGRRSLLIEVDEEAVIEGFTLPTDTL